MEYTTIHSYQVLQRNKEDKAIVRLSNGEYRELVAGGPYEIEDAHDILVGDVWVLAGQSNMEGVGDLIAVEASSPFVHSFQSREEWAIAEEPLHWLDESPRLVHHRLLGRDRVLDPLPAHDSTRVKGAGLGLTFAKERYKRTGVPVGLVPAAHGGTSMEQWDPNLRAQGDNSLYGAMLQRIAAVGGEIAGVLWYQGESEALPALAEVYQQRMNAFLEALRQDLSRPDLPFYLVQIGRFVTSERQEADWPHQTAWNSIREIQRTWPATQTRVGVVSSIDLELDDQIHIGTRGLQRLGHRLADLVDGLPPPEVQEVKVEADQARIRLVCRHARGGLRAQGRPAGFSLRNAQGEVLPLIFKITLEQQEIVLHLTTASIPPGTALWYGWGLDPYCNVVDAGDAALLALGPLALT